MELNTEEKKEEAEEDSDDNIENMEPDEYVRHIQKRTYQENVERALRLNEYEWDV